MNLENVENHQVYPIAVKFRNQIVYTCFYNKKEGSVQNALFSDGRYISSFSSMADLQAFCRDEGLVPVGSAAVLDFDLPNDADAPAREILNRWNLISTAATTLRLFFEGNGSQYDEVYGRLLQKASNKGEQIPLTDKQWRQLDTVFAKQSRILDRFRIVSESAQAEENT